MRDTTLAVLLAESIDYAGLFPPAGLPMATTVANYARYRAGPDAWALGRLVVPVARLAELERAAEAVAPEVPDNPWRVSALVGPSAAEDLETLGEFNRRHVANGAAALTADVVEAKADSVATVDQLLDAVPSGAQAYVEIPLSKDPAPLVAAIARRGARAKARTGGVTADAFPASSDLLRFLRVCAEAEVPFKVTAGLHHPLRAEYPLTYSPDSPRGTMFGFLNVFLTTAFLRNGLGDEDALRLLEERSATAFRFGPDAIEWRDHRLDRDAVEGARATGIVAFGSCSFEEPVGEARERGWI